MYPAFKIILYVSWGELELPDPCDIRLRGISYAAEPEEQTPHRVLKGLLDFSLSLHNLARNQASAVAFLTPYITRRVLSCRFSREWLPDCLLHIRILFILVNRRRRHAYSYQYLGLRTPKQWPVDYNLHGASLMLYRF